MGTLLEAQSQSGADLAFTDDFGTHPASGLAPQSRAREVHPKSEVGRGAGSGSGSDRQTAGKRYHILDCDSMRAFTNDFGTCPALGPAPQSRAREVRPKSEVGRGRGPIGKPRESGTIYWIVIQCPAPQSRAREVRPKSKVNRLLGRGQDRGRIDEPRESGTICGTGIQSGRKVFGGQNVQIPVLPSPRDRFVRDRTSAGNAITRFRAGVGPFESY
ncbi:hypothetical protein BKA70DRAFT_1219864 [Coprinopsis sp. MPI-PUGE-AT-0042]|nr:hypothetical protein BKA70DRAFT_1219864 [Coprinopsis sp. MPI-PUGE-AT-0042]